ncbi:hypothetical protein POM88_037917 [Heracleum sosnowskyi]|uniref:Uncharacterized protein n=1 Tax=Heracleum sosnowskyi TaxID=360622 RepID=A0AAD8HR43_9APIA|nr:hypothetical protein POM88_037917 [Heracleum sosnowskyi]
MMQVANVLHSHLSLLPRPHMFPDSVCGRGSRKLFQCGQTIKEHVSKNASGAKIVTPRQLILNNINNPGLHMSLDTEFVERDNTSVKNKISRTVSTSGHGSNNTEIKKTANVGSSSSGVNNLLSEFNDADEDQIEKDPSDDYILNPENQVYENVVSDEEVDEEAAHRGEYYSMLKQIKNLNYLVSGSRSSPHQWPVKNDPAEFLMDLMLRYEFHDETDKAYPTVVKELSGRDITVQIELNDDNILLSTIVYHATDAYQSVICNSSKSETTISGFGASGFGDNNLIEVSGTGTTPGSIMIFFCRKSEEEIASSSYAVLESVRKNLAKISF